jgi:hypothetical protein
MIDPSVRGHGMPGENLKSKWYLNPIVVLVLLFFVLGPLGLPLLYRSPHFGRTSRIILTIVTIIYTAYIFYESVILVKSMLKWVLEMQGLAI